MGGRVRYSLWARIVLVGLYQIGIVVQFLAAGYGLFEGSFDFHEWLGWTVMHGIPLLVLIATLVLFRGGTQLWLALALGILGLLQPILASAEGWAGVVHPLNALVLFLLGQALLRRDVDRVRARELPAAGETAPAA